MWMQSHVDFKDIIVKNVDGDDYDNNKHDDLENDDDGDERMVKKGWWQHQISKVPEKKLL